MKERRRRKQGATRSWVARLHLLRRVWALGSVQAQRRVDLQYTATFYATLKYRAPTTYDIKALDAAYEVSIEFGDQALCDELASREVEVSEQAWQEFYAAGDAQILLDAYLCRSVGEFGNPDGTYLQQRRSWAIQLRSLRHWALELLVALLQDAPKPQSKRGEFATELKTRPPPLEHRPTIRPNAPALI
jgi:hypothetical protein